MTHTMLDLPVTDAQGNALLRLAVVDEHDVPLDGAVPCPLALVVAESASGVLFGMNRWRRQWELLGGMIEPGETPRVAAAREFGEESGTSVQASALAFEGVVTFQLVDPDRRELAAVFSVAVPDALDPQPNDEIDGFRWFDGVSTGGAVDRNASHDRGGDDDGGEAEHSDGSDDDTSLLDLAIARWVLTLRQARE